MPDHAYGFSAALMGLMMGWLALGYTDFTMGRTWFRWPILRIYPDWYSVFFSR